MSNRREGHQSEGPSVSFSKYAGVLMKHRLVCSLVIGLSYASAAAADPPPPTIKGTYAAVGSNTCLVAPGFSAGSPTNPTPGTPLPNSGFNSNFVPKDSASSFQTSLSDEGIWVFDGQ